MGSSPARVGRSSRLACCGCPSRLQRGESRREQPSRALMAATPDPMIAAASAAPDLTSFYGAFTPLCFTLLGLWLIVVQTRHSEWRRSPVHRSRAYTLSIQFALPGMMGLLSLVHPGNQTLWRAAFACVALAGVAILVGM